MSRELPLLQMCSLLPKLTGHKLILSKAKSFELFWADFQPQQALLLLHHLPSELLELEIIGCGVSITKGYVGSL